jgi:hypothetical protein
VNHALLWNGTSTAIDLSPTNLSGFSGSVAYGVFGGKQVGAGGLVGSTNQDALLWNGSANTAVDLGPAGYSRSAAMATNGQSEVGWGYGPATNQAIHALLWNGTNVPIDLQALLPSGYYSSHALSIDANGDVFGYATDNTNYDLHAVEWVAVPEPTSLSALPLLALAALRRTRRVPLRWPRWSGRREWLVINM